MAVIRTSYILVVFGPGQPGSCLTIILDGWQMSIRPLLEGKMGQPVLLEDEGRMYVQPLEVHLGDTGQPGPAELDGRMDAYANWEVPGKGRGATLYPNQV